MSEFPSRTEALAILYLQNQDLTGKSPSEINTIYWEAYYQIKNDYWEKKSNGYFDKRNDEEYEKRNS